MNRMERLTTATKKFFSSDEGATLVEYGLLVGLLSIVAVAAILAVAQYVHGAFDKVQTEMATGGIPSR